jgi:hypothetical protein
VPSKGNDTSDNEGDEGGAINPQDNGEDLSVVDPLVRNDGGDSLSTAGIIAIAAAAAACLLCCFFIAGCCRRDRDDARKKLMAGGSIETEETPNLRFLAGNGTGDTRDKSSFSSSQKGEFVFGMWVSAQSSSVSVQAIMNAIDNANWDEVYTLASQLAEKEDLSTLSSAGKANDRRPLVSDNRKARIGLSTEDQERTRTLDELVDLGDWTGVAVTAALYAGESGSSRENRCETGGVMDILAGMRSTSRAAAAALSKEKFSAAKPTAVHPVAIGAGTFTDDTRSGEGSNRIPSIAGLNLPHSQHSRRSKGQTILQAPSSASPAALGLLEEEIDLAVDAEDWDRVLLVSSLVQNNEEFQNNMSTVSASAPRSGFPMPASSREELDRAVHLGDWALVSYYANRIIQKRGGHEAPAVESTAIVPVTRVQAIPPSRSIDTSDSERSKRYAIEKLIHEEKWNGVSILAGLYSFSAKGDQRSAPNSSGWNVLLPGDIAQDTSNGHIGIITPPP